MSYCLYKDSKKCDFFVNNSCNSTNELCKKTRITFAFKDYFLKALELRSGEGHNINFTNIFILFYDK